MAPPIIAAVQLQSRHRAATISLVIGCGMLGLKMGAYLITNSATVLSDALESVVHVVATVFMFWCFRLSAAPPDAEHPYGHGRAEGLSIGFEGGMVALAGLAIAWEALHSIWQGAQPKDLGVGLWLIATAAAINLVLGAYLVRTGRGTGSPLLVADGQHVLADVWTSLGVLAGVGTMLLVHEPRWRSWIDGLVAIGLAAYMVLVAAKLIRSAFAVLLDQIDPKLLQQILDAIAEIREPEWIDVHNLRCRTSGDHVFVDFHLTVPADWSVQEGHRAIERLEHHVLAKLGRPGAVLVHLDYPHFDDATPMPMAALRPQPLTMESATQSHSRMPGHAT